MPSGHPVGFSFFCDMATDRDTLKLQKGSGGEVKDLYEDFGFKTTSVPLFFPLEVKDPPSRDWQDEDGEDVYFPENAKLKAYETDVSVLYTGAMGTSEAKMKSLFSYLITGGSEISIYSPYSNTGCKGAYLKGFSDIELESSEQNGDILSLTINLKVSKPGESYSV